MELQCIADVINKSNDLSKFIKQINQLSKINQAVKQYLEPMLANQCQVANLRNGTLILTTSSSIWGHQLRFQEMALLSALRATQEWCGLKAIQSRVAPTHPPHTTAPPKPYEIRKSRLSLKHAAHLQSLAHYTVHPRLKQALLNLADYAITGYK